MICLIKSKKNYLKQTKKIDFLKNFQIGMVIAIYIA